MSGLKCLGCGAPISVEEKYCQYCGHRIDVAEIQERQLHYATVSTNDRLVQCAEGLHRNPNNLKLKDKMAISAIELGQYDNAIEQLETILANGTKNVDVYFYYAVALLRGLKPFVHKRNVIDSVENSIRIATQLANKPVYYYLWAYVKFDYFLRKHFRTSPTYTELIEKACNTGLTETDAIFLFGLLHVECPEELLLSKFSILGAKL